MGIQTDFLANPILNQLNIYAVLINCSIFIEKAYFILCLISYLSLGKLDGWPVKALFLPLRLLNKWFLEERKNWALWLCSCGLNCYEMRLISHFTPILSSC